MTSDFLQLLLPVYGTYLIAAASPGPSNMAIIGTAMTQGRAAAMVLVLGVMTGSMAWAALAACGISTVLAAHPGALHAVRIGGGLYLLWLARKSALAALAPGEMRMAAAPEPRRALYRKGLLLHLANPKSVLGWAAILSLGLRPEAPPHALQAMVGGCALLGLAVFSGYAAAFSAPPMARAYARARRWIEGGLAAVFGYGGLRLLLARG
ncbi:LysE family translocator [Mangrovicoccus sp. HB161399]|uniref:LysE family translocator n=1 Tax=Mangrovicoccus sp. HB161399 TaxID=2720392 RepID=UPI00155225C9|nr:LysE family translocator [Mangrovicoccus sp. HB161399]